MNFANVKIENPKRKKAASGWEEFFPYYAGYSESFARGILASAALDRRAIVLDPWNGSGTTTYAGAQMGFSTIGMDINPVMVIVARARTLPASEADSLLPIASEIVKRARYEQAKCAANDPLRWWFEEGTANWLRSIERSIEKRLLGNLSIRPDGVHFDKVSSLAATFYVALFNLSKNLAAAFQSSNPTWMRKPKSHEPKLIVSEVEINDRFHAKIRSMSNALSVSDNMLFNDLAPVVTYLRDSTSPVGLEKAIDFVLTSPPYCTRIDYTAATRVQLAVLHPMLESTVDELSRRMIGSVKVPKDDVELSVEWGSTCCNFLNRLREHSSKASSGYYSKSHSAYFDKIYRSLRNISYCLKDGGGAVLVVQDSYYKELHNDVPSIIIEMAEKNGLRFEKRADFQVRRSMSGINTRAQSRRGNLGNTEAVLCFQKAN